MVRALLDGRKTQTRRILKPKKHACLLSEGWTDDYILDPGNREWLESYYPWRAGDRLWVRETLKGRHGWVYDADDAGVAMAHGDARIPEMIAWAHHKEGDHCVSIHMPRWASRLTLTVTDVRVERLQEISKADVIAEGCTERDGLPLADVYAGWHEPYAALWNKINGDGAWEKNPWVVAVTFRAAQHNIDRPLLIAQAAVVERAEQVSR